MAELHTKEATEAANPIRDEEVPISEQSEEVLKESLCEGIVSLQFIHSIFCRFVQAWRTARVSRAIVSKSIRQVGLIHNLVPVVELQCPPGRQVSTVAIRIPH